MRRQKVRATTAGGSGQYLFGPIFQQPLSLGADVSVYSATKYLAGHSDMLAGVVMGSDANLIASLRGTRAILGNILQPDECWILDSRLPTVELRMNRQSKNASRIVRTWQRTRKSPQAITPRISLTQSSAAFAIRSVATRRDLLAGAERRQKRGV